jgi:hypothetical protein
MLEVNPGLVGPDRLEVDLDLGHEFRIELEVRRDLPGQNEPLRWLPDQDLAPVGLGPVDTSLEPAPAGKRVRSRPCRSRMNRCDRSMATTFRDAP